MANNKLDQGGIVLPLAIAAVLVIGMYLFFTGVIGPKRMASTPAISSASDLDTSLKDVDSQNPDSFTTDLNSNSSDAANF